MNVLATLAPPVDGRQSETASKIGRGVCRLLCAHGFSCVSELSLASGRRADLVALGRKSEIWIVEIKSSVADFRADHKWPDYRIHCDRFFFAVAPDMPAEILPESAGLIVADGFGAEILRDAPEHALSAATRKAMLLRFAHAAAARLGALHDPGLAAFL